MQTLTVFLDQRISDPSFIRNDIGNNFLDAVDQLMLGLAERHLIRDLVEVSHGLAAFSV